MNFESGAADGVVVKSTEEGAVATAAGVDADNSLDVEGSFVCPFGTNQTPTTKKSAMIETASTKL